MTKELYERICVALRGCEADDFCLDWCSDLYDLLKEVEENCKPEGGGMTVKDIFSKAFYERFGDVDVYNDVTDDAFCAFCGGLALTEYGEQYFADALGIEITAEGNPYNCIMLKLDKYGDDWERYFDNANELFNCAAGYCTTDEYGMFFTEQED